LTAASVSIVIPTYNRATRVTRAIDSVLAQQYHNLDLIVVDDGSTDGTAAVLANYHAAGVRVITHERNRGAAAAKNTGLDAVRGTFASILDSDDELLPGAIETIVNAFARLGPDYGMVFGNCADAATGEWTGRGLTASCDVTYADAITGRFQGEFWGLWRTAALGQRRFDPRLNGGEALVWHDMYRTTRVHYLHEAFRRYERRSADSVSRKQLEQSEIARTRLIYQLYLERFGDDLRRLSPRAYARQRQALALWYTLEGERAAAWRQLGASIRHGDQRQWVMAAAMAVAPRGLLRRAVARRRGR
jgi:GalNAc5-diNAcBac-PP-undecaprenol beta-1,3-glucosyltransferase